MIVALDEVGGKALSMLPTRQGAAEAPPPRGRRTQEVRGADRDRGDPRPRRDRGGGRRAREPGRGQARGLAGRREGPADGDDPARSDAAAPASPPPPPPPSPDFVPPPKEEPVEPAPGTPEYEARKKAREDLERKEKGVESERRKEQAKTALADATEFARNNSDDKGRVARKYREVAIAWKGTESGTEAQRRADGVEKGEIHPHPDRSFATKSAVDTAREALAANLPKIEEAIAARRYDDMTDLIPEVVDDPAGKVTEELRFWRGLAKNLSAFSKGLKKEVAGLPAAQRIVKTAKGVLPVRTATDTGLQVERDSDLVDLRWADIEPAALADLATAAFAEKDYAESLAAFAFAHRLENLYWQAVLSLSDVARERSALMEARAEARFAK